MTNQENSTISKNDVLYVASLSRIHLRDEEIEQLTQDLEKIVHYVKKLEDLQLDNVPPTSHVLPLKNVYREDIAETTLTQEDAMKLAVEKHNGFFKVPKVIE